MTTQSQCSFRFAHIFTIFFILHSFSVLRPFICSHSVLVWRFLRFATDEIPWFLLSANECVFPSFLKVVSLSTEYDKQLFSFSTLLISFHCLLAHIVEKLMVGLFYFEGNAFFSPSVCFTIFLLAFIFLYFQYSMYNYS